ncbi:hypothetical protein ACFSGX_14785 [Sphingomonas arantia]|uniref:Uncharacterized protein n=1 Tax=Sphingomonas arantia TaxID=1460676 RepID=A0ABW4TZC4_9SPHN
MYAYLDRPVAALSTADRVLLDAMRNWALAATLGRDRAANAAARLPESARVGATDALHAAMTLLDGADAAPIAFQRPCHARVEEDEAVLLGIAALVPENPAAATAALALLVPRSTAALAIRHLTTFHRRLTPALQG